MLKAIVHSLPVLFQSKPAPAPSNEFRQYAMNLDFYVHDILTAGVSSLIIHHLYGKELSYPIPCLEDLDAILPDESGNVVLTMWDSLLVRNFAAYLLMKQTYSPVPIVRSYTRQGLMSILSRFLCEPMTSIAFELH